MHFLIKIICIFLLVSCSGDRAYLIGEEDQGVGQRENYGHETLGDDSSGDAATQANDEDLQDAEFIDYPPPVLPYQTTGIYLTSTCEWNSKSSTGENKIRCRLEQNNVKYGKQVFVSTSQNGTRLTSQVYKMPQNDYWSYTILISESVSGTVKVNFYAPEIRSFSVNVTQVVPQTIGGSSGSSSSGSSNTGSGSTGSSNSGSVATPGVSVDLSPSTIPCSEVPNVSVNGTASTPDLSATGAKLTASFGSQNGQPVFNDIFLQFSDSSVGSQLYASSIVKGGQTLSRLQYNLVSRKVGNHLLVEAVSANGGPTYRIAALENGANAAAGSTYELIPQHGGCSTRLDTAGGQLSGGAGYIVIP